MDELEKHIRDKRETMDIHQPDPSVWDRIETQLPRKRRTPIQQMWKAAAALIVAVASLTLILRMTGTPGTRENSAQSIVRETEQYYNSLLASLYSEAEPLLTANPVIRTELEAGMSELDTISMSIREDLKDNVANGEVIEALIRNYRLRIELLEDMLSLMNEKKPDTEKNGEYEL
jgi:hypothetical protein